jgi:hypothetical protein
LGTVQAESRANHVIRGVPWYAKVNAFWRSVIESSLIRFQSVCPYAEAFPKLNSAKYLHTLYLKAEAETSVGFGFVRTVTAGYYPVYYMI